ncbi:hypothetical protein CDAR_25021 [Caerostris darwini]|uniref:Protein NATD1 n=1 Tax=Caerostris darwini TaxID=1538125 RepID=A0AAV4RLE4_9ARAC|nr:hypothetical protein CDAR_25021 [Caerostris darwini]
MRKLPEIQAVTFSHQVHGSGSSVAYLQYRRGTSVNHRGDGEKAFLQYRTLSSNIIELEHTVVPETFQGKGIGKLLAEAALEYAIDKKLTVKITCRFVQKYMEKNPKPEFKNVLAC